MCALHGCLCLHHAHHSQVESGMLKKAMHIVHTDVAQTLTATDIPKDTPIMVYCRSGNRSGQAKQALEAIGYKNVTNAGGYDALRYLDE